MAGAEVEESDVDVFDLIVSGDKDGLVAFLNGSANVSQIVERRDSRGRPCCALAVIAGKAECLAVLIDKGARLDYRTHHGLKLHHLAAMWGHVDCLKLLLENGFDLEEASREGETPLDLAIRCNQPETKDFMMILRTRAAMTDTIKKVKSLMSDSEKMSQVKVTKEERGRSGSACAKKLEWLNSAKHNNCTWEELHEQEEQLMEAVGPVLEKFQEVGLA